MRTFTNRAVTRRTAPLLFGMLTLISCSESTSVATPLEIQITAPSSAVSVLVGDTVVLTAVATDPRDGPLTGSAIVWSAGAEPSFATGVDARWRAPAVGTFVIRARATGSALAQATDSVTITATANATPTITSSSLLPALRVYSTDTVILAMIANDTESGALKGNRVQWVSSLDGALGTGDTLAVPSRTLRAGVHTLTGYARDPQGFQDSTVFTLMVDSTSSRILWTRRFAGSAAGPLLTLANDGSLRFVSFQPYANCSSNCLVALTANGRDMWQVANGQVFSHSGGLTIDPNGTTFTMDARGEGKAVEANGTVRWTKDISGHDPHGRFALAPNGALFMTGNRLDGIGGGFNAGTLARVNPTNGELLWTVGPLDGQRFNSFGAYIDPLGRAVGAPNHRLVWATPEGIVEQSDTTRMTWALINRSAMGADGSLYGTLGTNQTAGIAPDGTRKWTATAFATAIFSSEAVVDASSVVYVSVNGSAPLVRAYRGSDGTILWTTPLTAFLPDIGGAYPSIALTNDGGSIATVASGVHALSNTGAIRWAVPLATSIVSNIVIGADGTIYVITGDARLVAIRGDAPLSTTAPWATFRADNRGTSSVLK